EKYLEFFKDCPDFLKPLRKRLGEPNLKSAFYGLLLDLEFALPKNAAEHQVEMSEEGRQQTVMGILPIYQKPSDHLPIYMLSEALVEFDEYLGLWREHHVRVVERVIGSKMGTGGSQGVEYLRTTVGKKCFPALWEVRTYLK